MFERRPKLTASLAVLAIGAATLLLVSKTREASRRPQGTIWFYDLKTRSLFAAPDVSVPPIDTPSGAGMGVRAYVYAIEGDSNPTNRFIAFLETLSPEVKRDVETELKGKKAQVPIGFALEKRSDGILVSDPDRIEWVPKFSLDGLAVMEGGKARAAGRPIRPSLP